MRKHSLGFSFDCEETIGWLVALLVRSRTAFCWAFEFILSRQPGEKCSRLLNNLILNYGKEFGKF